MEAVCHPKLIEIRVYSRFEPGKGKELVGKSERAECDACGEEIYRGMVRCFCGREIRWDEPSAETVEVRDEGEPETMAPYLGIDADPGEWAEEKA